MSLESLKPDPLDQLAESFLARLRAGEHPALSDYEVRHPELAADIRELFPALVVMEQGRKCVEERPTPDPGQLSEKPLPQKLGEYRLLRQIGRGGMGVVYEAWQESLGRHVALKVLPFNTLIQPEHLERFRREARAAARLHHTNIVPVFGVGEDQGIHYYAMQFIQGQGLDAVLHEVRRLRGGEKALPERPALATTVAQAIMSGRFGDSAGTQKAAAGDVTFLPPRAEVTGIPPISPRDPAPSDGSAASRLNLQGEGRYFVAVASIGQQAAEALEYAHRQGVVHRDVKPSNLLLDTAGRLWISDFGLAKAEDTEELTQPGAILGTLRYMAPERFRGQADCRSDVYGLGITLYELVTLRPAFVQGNQGALVEQITRLEPARPRKLDPRIPRDLETIVLKAMAKEPPRRYATAGELADDLRRFLGDRPIRARRTPWRERAWRWCRRNPALTGLLASVAALLLVIAAGAGWVTRDRTAREAALDDQVSRALDETEARIEGSQWTEALAALAHAEKLLAAANRTEQPARLAEMRRDVAMAQRLEDIYSQPSQGDFDNSGQGQDQEYARAFRSYGIDLAALPVAEASDRIRARAIRPQLARALDIWSITRRRFSPQGAPDWRRLLEVARAADPDPWRNRLRDALARDEFETLLALSAAPDVRHLPPETLALLGENLVFRTQPWQVGHLILVGRIPRLQPSAAIEQISAFLRKAQRQYPQDLWLNTALAAYCMSTTKQYDEAARFYTAALTLRPNSPTITYLLGEALYFKGAYLDAAAHFSRALEMKPDNLAAVMGRAATYQRLGRPEEALADCARAIELRCRDIEQLSLTRGWAYAHLRQWDKAAAEFSKLVTMPPTPGSARAAFNVACLRLLNGDKAGYRRICTQLIWTHLLERAQPGREAFPPDVAALASRTCMLHRDTGTEPRQAVRWAEAAVARQPRWAHYLHILALAQYRAGQFDAAARSCRRSLEVSPGWGGRAVNWLLLGMAETRRGQLDEGKRWLDKAAQWRAAVLAGKRAEASPPDMPLPDWLEFQVLYPEAEALMR
jgi:serine/threonine protein kinase/Flp pilus assembly protein TadD